MRLDALYWGLGWTLAALILAAHVLGATSFVGDWWATHFYAFFPRPVLWIACAGLMAGAVASARPWPWLERLWDTQTRRRLPGSPAVRLMAASVLSFVLFWALRERHTFLGDGNPLTAGLPRGQHFHPDEPLTLLLHHVFYRLTHGLFESTGRLPEDVARETVNLSSALAGALFIPIAWALARELVRARTPGETGEPAGGEASLGPLLLLVLLAQGYVQLFFGHVENYTFYLLVLAAYVLAALRFLAGRSSLLLPGSLLLLGLALHLSGVVLLPSLGVLVLMGLGRRARRSATLRDLGVLGVLFAILSFAFARISPGYSFSGMLLRLGDAATDPLSHGFSHPSPGEFLNQQALIGPMGLFLLLPTAALALPRGAWRDPRSPFLLAMASGYLGASLIAGPANLGMARNWDLMAPAGFVFTLGGLGLALHAAWRLADLRRWLLLLVCASLFHTAPWVAVNASFDRAFERFKTLPLGGGRTESSVGDWYLRHGQEGEAIEWFLRAVDENPYNNFAHYGLGLIAMKRRDYPFATKAFGFALRVRPTKQNYRLALVDALARSGDLPQARAHLDTLLTESPSEPTYWAVSAIVWRLLGAPDSSFAAIAVAERLAPGDQTLARLRIDLVRPEGLTRTLRDVWPDLVKY